MSKRDPFVWPTGFRRFNTLRYIMRRGEDQPKVGVTQGGSSRKDAGAKPAATDGLARPKKLGVDT